MELTQKEYWFWLDSRRGIGRVKRKRLLECLQSVEAVFAADEKELQRVPGLRKADIDTLLDKKEKEKVREDYENLLKKGIRLLVNGEKEYPKKLSYIYDAPHVLYVRGKLPDPHKKAIAIVGARNCTAYGMELSAYFGKQLAKAGMEVISGLARGIDSAAHRGAVAAGREMADLADNLNIGSTYGILGCGIDRCYPIENLDLFMEVEKKGGLISEFGMGVLPLPGNFPLRNRLISGLCDGVLVVEAKEKSGSLITAQLGLEQGKDIFAIPGRSCDVYNRGCNRLIKEGAFLVEAPEDILDFYKLEMQNIWREDEKR